MIEILKKKIKGLDEYKSIDVENLSILKYCTPASGISPGGKVIFLVFDGSSDTPFFCIKTVRKPADNHAIEDGFNNLKKLNQEVDGSAFENMFPRAILLSKDEQGISFSIETACTGGRATINESELIVGDYIKFQNFLSRKKTTITAGDYFKKIINQLDIDESNYSKINNYFDNNFDLGVILDLVPQHGDITLDNIFIADTGTQIFDCERFGMVNLAGFDLFHFLQKRGSDNFIDANIQTFDKYFQAINSKAILSKLLVFLYCLNEINIKSTPLAGKVNYDFIVNNFEKFI